MPSTRPTFAKPRAAPAPSAQRPTGLAAVLGPFANPYIGAGTAGAFFLCCAALLVTLTGDPKAGTPVVRLSLAKITETSAPPGWREALPPPATSDNAPFDSTLVSLSTGPAPSARARPRSTATR